MKSYKNNPDDVLDWKEVKNEANLYYEDKKRNWRRVFRTFRHLF
ncbi:MULTISPECIES: hypothetical protein [Mesonia]|nr:hypothetical protein [Mesonia sp.]